jgi:putative endonuclease
MPRQRQPAIYIMGNQKPTLYIGVTSNLIQRAYHHKQKLIPGFTAKYNLNKLLYFETYDTMEQAITREKQLKRWHRQWKLNLIKKTNPTFNDLYDQIVSN